MIAIDLQCINNHVFEGWFEDNRAYEQQERKRLIACPFCDETTVARIPSTFAIKTAGTPEKMPPLQKEQLELMRAGKKIVDFVEKNFDDVGCEFATETLKMHYGVSEPRNIRGVSTEEEEKVLEKEGITFFKIPMPVQSDTDTETDA